MSISECIWADNCSIINEKCEECEYMDYCYDTYNDEQTDFYAEWNNYIENFYN